MNTTLSNLKYAFFSRKYFAFSKIDETIRYDKQIHNI